ncbi:MAG: hypothetical protein NTY90_03810 [Candidatus Micrarchaeota archaeon]|nr:hypothetical protein [Candidatus Micrarchaeota archaeon]
MPYEKVLNELRKKGVVFYGPKSGLKKVEKGWVIKGLFLAKKAFRKTGEEIMRKHLPEYFPGLIKPLAKRRVERLATKPEFQEFMKKGGAVHQLMIFVPKEPPKNWEPKIYWAQREAAWKKVVRPPRKGFVEKLMGVWASKNELGK